MGVACFDFDGTLIRFDSFPLFLALIAGWPRVIGVSLRSLTKLMVSKRQAWPDQNWKSALKICLVQSLLKDQSVDFLKQKIIPRLKAKIQWNDDVVRELQRHKALGHLIVIISGGLQLYLPDLLQDLPIDSILATDLEVKDGVLTGQLNGENCVRHIKPARIKAYLKELKHDKDPSLWVYGNSAGDIPMLKIAQHGFWIKKGKIQPWKKIDS